MEHLGETILLPKVSPLPNTLAHYKRLARSFPDGAIVKVYYNEGARRLNGPIIPSPFNAIVVDQRWNDVTQRFLARDNSGVDYSTVNDILVEVTPLEGTMVENPRFATLSTDKTINDDAIVAKIRDTPGFLSLLPRQIWDRPIFVQKFIAAKLALPAGVYIPQRVKDIAAAERTDFASSLNGLPLQRKLQEKDYAHGLVSANRVRGFLGMAPVRPLPQEAEDRITAHTNVQNLTQRANKMPRINEGMLSGHAPHNPPFGGRTKRRKRKSRRR